MDKTIIESKKFLDGFLVFTMQSVYALYMEGSKLEAWVKKSKVEKVL